ncbi:unnamed protein product [Bursaphelenchus xylophilus]|uniref:(pine wood nematode) hypothetical protein n=1 Tax=Bursaphelenchus xylophilus TaxID=6326 RepID=A0A1I7RV30_BURXY|nr:unnamed protein product [Bursaphelenchus xylophilus]CAG9105169.1 unnamed protein product [Bursaphelenchus xylophilus]
MVDVFQIILDKRHAWLFPGSIISGTVYIQTSAPVKARAVEVFFEGKACTGWSETERCGDETHTIHFAADIIYARHEQVVWRPPPGQGEGFLQPGTHQCRFRFQIPLNAAPSFEGGSGSIRYRLVAKIDRPWKIDDTQCVAFTVVPYFDLNLLPYSGYPLLREFHKTLECCCHQYGRAIARLFVNKSGFVPGELIPIRMEVENYSDKGVKWFEAILYQIHHFTASHGGRQCMRHDQIPIASLQRAFVPMRFANFVHEDLLQVPACVPSFNCCPIIQVEYALRVCIEINVLVGRMACEVPVLIGSVPVLKPVDVPRDQIHTGNQLAPPEPTAPPKGFTPQMMQSPTALEPLKEVKDEKERISQNNPGNSNVPGLKIESQVQDQPKTPVKVG